MWKDFLEQTILKDIMGVISNACTRYYTNTKYLKLKFLDKYIEEQIFENNSRLRVLRRLKKIIWLRHVLTVQDVQKYIDKKLMDLWVSSWIWEIPDDKKRASSWSHKYRVWQKYSEAVSQWISIDNSRTWWLNDYFWPDV